jgi:cytidylate kinase
MSKMTSPSLGTVDSSSSNSDAAILSFELLSLQNAETSSAVLTLFADNSLFQQLSQYEGDLTQARDQEDDEKLKVGVDIARAKGVIDPDLVPAAYRAIDVHQKTPEQVADLILQHVQATKEREAKAEVSTEVSSDEQASTLSSSSSSSTGAVIAIVGRSGTGKGTTVSEMVRQLSVRNQPVVTWSNGNVFRAITLLATTYADEHKLSIEEVLTKELLAGFVSQLSFTAGGNDCDDDDAETRNATGTIDQFDIVIAGVGRVSEIQNTVLKSPQVSQHIPTVAKLTQGEVIQFCASALQTLAARGVIVLLEGREPTVNYVPTLHRFELILSQPELIGQRRAAQRIVGQAYSVLQQQQQQGSAISDEQVQKALEKALADMVQELA